MFRKPFNKKLKSLKSSVLHTELNENEQENICGGYTPPASQFWPWVGIGGKGGEIVSNYYNQNG